MAIVDDFLMFVSVIVKFFKQYLPLELIPLDIVKDHCLNDVLCMKLEISKLIGISIIMLSALLKVPIIYNIIKLHSASGLSNSSLYLEFIAYIVMIVYNLYIQAPFSTWGEMPLILIQNAIILYLLWKYEDEALAAGKTKKASSKGLVLSLFVALLAISIALPDEYKYLLTHVSTGCSIVGRLPQIYENALNGHTGVQSLITQSLLVAGGMTRLGTIMVQVDDINIKISFIIALSMNFAILFQIFWYRKNTIVVMKSKNATVAAKTNDAKPKDTNSKPKESPAGNQKGKSKQT